MLRRSPGLQDSCGHLTRSVLSRSLWLRSLRCRLAAASRTPSSVPRQQAAATSSPSYERRTAEAPSATCGDTRRRRRTRRTTDAPTDSAAAVAVNTSLHLSSGSALKLQRAAGVQVHIAPQAALEVKLSKANASEAVAGTEADVQTKETAAVGESGSAAAALKQRRLAAAAARQQHEAVSTSGDGIGSPCSTPLEPQQCSRQHQGSHAGPHPHRDILQLTSRITRRSPFAVQQLGDETQQQQVVDVQSNGYCKYSGSSAPDDQLSSTQLTRAIQNASRPQELVQLLAAGAETLNSVHITAAAEALGRLARQLQHVHGEATPQYKSQVRMAYRNLCQLVSSQLLDLDSRAIITLLHCFTKMGSYHQQLRNQQLLGDLLHVSTNMMDDFSPQQLAMLVYAVAQGDSWVETKPSRRWWMLFFEVSQSNMSQFTPQGFANMVWALGKLQRRPGADWAAALYKSTQPVLDVFTPQGLANVGSGLGHMHAVGGLPRPPQSWINAYLASAQLQLEAFSSQGLANMLWALAKLGYCPPQEQLQSLVHASQAQLQHSTTQDLSLMVYSFAVLEVRLPESWWNKFWAASGNSMDEASSQALANTFYALGKLSRVPPTPWLLSFLPAMQHALPQCSPQAAANVLWAAGRLRLTQLPGSWLDSLLARVYQMLHESKAVELGLVLQALKQLQHRPSDKWLARFYTASQSKLSAFSPRLLAGVLEALAVLTPDCPPPAGWSNTAISQVSARLPVMSAMELASVMWGMSELRMVPDKDFMIRFMSVAVENMHQMNGALLARVLRTLVLLGQKPNTNWLSLLAEESYYHIDKMHPMPLADLVWGFGQLRYSPGPRWLARVLQVAQEQLPSLSAKPFVKLLQGAAGIKARPGVDWLAAAVLRVQQLLGELTGQELLQCVGAFERLGLGPGTVLLQQLSAGSLTSSAAAVKYVETAVAKAASSADGLRAVQHAGAGQLAVQPSVTSGMDAVQQPRAVSSAAAEPDGYSRLLDRLQLQQPQKLVAGCDHNLPAAMESHNQHVTVDTSQQHSTADFAAAGSAQHFEQPVQLEQSPEVSRVTAAAAGSAEMASDDTHQVSPVENIFSSESASTSSSGNQQEGTKSVTVVGQSGDQQSSSNKLVLLPKPQRPLRRLTVPAAHSPFVASR